MVLAYGGFTDAGARMEGNEKAGSHGLCGKTDRGRALAMWLVNRVLVRTGYTSASHSIEKFSHVVSPTKPV